MARRKKKAASKARPKQGDVTLRTGRATAHGRLGNDLVHVFVDDQNLFWGIVNDDYGPGFRIDFGRLLLASAEGSDGKTRGVAGAYIAGVIPDDDSFWSIAENRGFTVRRGYLGKNSRSKQDDAYLIVDMARTICEEQGPSTIVLVAGDADYVPPLKLAIERNWRAEVAFIDRGISSSLEQYTHEIRLISPSHIQYIYER